MKIERLKSILLIMLVISSIVLTANNWYDKELWPEGYSLFSGIKKHFSNENENIAKAFNPTEEVLRPAQIIINKLNNHILYTKSSGNYEDLCDEITALLDVAFSSHAFTDSNVEEWNNRLKTDSCYFSYPVIYDATYFSSQLSGIYPGKTRYFREFLVSVDQIIPSTLYLYIKDPESDNIEKIQLEYEGNRIDELIKDAQNNSTDVSYFSFELNFNNADESGVKDHVIIDGNVLINIAEKRIQSIRENNVFEDIALNDTMCKSILEIFNYNTSGIRKYVEADNSVVFVENYGTLKLHSNGILDYKSLDSTNGITLEGNSVNACLNSCITFVNKITSVIPTNGMYYEITSDIHDINSKSFTLTFDYFINDNQIIMPHERYQIKNAVSVTVENGKITSYTQLFNSFELIGTETNLRSAIDAIDMLEYENKKDNEVVTDIFSAYSYNADTEIWQPHWYVENSDGNISTISMNTEVQ